MNEDEKIMIPMLVLLGLTFLAVLASIPFLFIIGGI